MTSADPRSTRWAWAEIDEDAIRENVALLVRQVAPAAAWAIVKADGYGHGALTAARAALEGGATGLGVALAQEGIELRAAGIVAPPVLVLSQQPVEHFAAMVEHALTPTLYDLDAIAAFGAAVRNAGRTDVGVHLKFDTGMRRVGAQPSAAVALADAVRSEAPALRLEGVFTHLAVADEPTDPTTTEQLARFDAVLTDLRSAGHEPELVHAANSAGAVAHPHGRRDLVRLGIAIYGIEPGPGVAELCTGLRPAMRLVARAGLVKPVAAGDRISYGLRHRFEQDSVVATVPIGYADGVPRRLFAAGGEVLVGGRRRPIVGVVTMDQLMVDCGPVGDPVADAVRVGDEVVLLGSQGAERIRPEEWADRLGTIAYEIVCGISHRIQRHPLRR